MTDKWSSNWTNASERQNCRQAEIQVHTCMGFEIRTNFCTRNCSFYIHAITMNHLCWMDNNDASSPFNIVFNHFETVLDDLLHPILTLCQKQSSITFQPVYVIQWTITFSFKWIFASLVIFITWWNWTCTIRCPKIIRKQLQYNPLISYKSLQWSLCY